MPYLVLLPSLLCGAAVSYTDIRERRVPRRWIALGYATQFLALLLWCVSSNQLFTLMLAVVISLAAAVLQLLLGLIKPGSLGFGDVTITLVMGLAVGAVGWTAVLYWWIAMGVIGLAAIINARMRGRHDVPFAPVIVASSVLGVLLASFA